MSDNINSKLKILLCEPDEDEVRKLYNYLLEIDEDIFIATDTITANKIFDEQEPDILIVSQNINSNNVIEFIQNIKIKKQSQAIIMILNDEIDSSIFKSSINLQVDKYLNTPVQSNLLLNSIETLSREKIWQADYRLQKKLLQEYKDAIDKSFSVSKHDKDGKIFFVNESFCETTKLSYEEAMLGGINPLINPHAMMDKVWEELKTNKIYRDRQIFKLDDKENHIIDVTAVGIGDEFENIEEYLVFSKDVTEVVQSARKIKEQEANQQLQKLEHIKELNEMKDSFLSVFSHELKTPLNSIINFSQYIKKHLKKEDFKKRDVLIEQVSQINMSGWHMLDMITNLIDSVRLREGEVKLIKSRVIVKNILDDILFKYKDDLTDIKIIKSYDEESYIVGDEVRLKHLLDNLISNAIKYSKQTIAIIFKTNTQEFLLEVMDDGRGFENKENVFELFEQSNEDSMTRTAQGTGVGLFVVKKLCDLMKYKIDIGNSKKLGGARVSIKGKKD